MAKTWCPCGERQFKGDDGLITCANQHVGADVLGEQEAIALGFDVAKRLRRVIKLPKPEAPKRATIAKRSTEERELSDATCTPKWLADFFYETRGLFDLDPCSNPRSHIRSRWSFSLEKKLDGLRLPWRGSVFKNNPFSAPMLWQRKAVHELSIGRCTELVELCKMDPSTEWWDVITAPITIYRETSPDHYQPFVYAPDLWLFKDRVQYDEHPLLIEKRKQEIAEGKRKGAKSGKSSNNFCSAIIHHRFELPPLKLEKHAKLWRQP